MKKLVSLVVLISLISLGIPGVNRAEDGASTPLIIGVFPRRNATETTRMFLPLAHYLSKALGREVRLETAKDFDTFWQGVTDQRYDIVHYNQYHYVKTHQASGYRVILKNEEFGEATIAGSILVRSDSGIAQATDLRGKKIVFGGGHDAMQSYIVAKYLLLEHGLKPGEYEEEFAKNPPNAILSTYFGQSDAAGAGDKVLQLNVVSSQIDIGQMHYLLRGEQLPHLPWAVKGTMPDTLRDAIQRTLSRLRDSAEGRAVLAAAKLSDLVVATDEEYDAHRRIIRQTLGEEY